MTAHDWLDGFGGFVGVVEGNGADIVVQDVGFDDAVQKIAADEAKFAVNGCSSSTNIVPTARSVMGKRWIGVLQISNRNFHSGSATTTEHFGRVTYQANG